MEMPSNLPRESGFRDAVTRQWLPVMAWAAVIFIFSTGSFTPADTAKMVEPAAHAVIPGAAPAAIALVHALARKLAHFIEYGILFWLLVRGPVAGRPNLALLLCFVYALTDEGHQIFVPGRTATMFDVVLDSSGALFTRYLLDFIRELA